VVGAEMEQIRCRHFEQAGVHEDDDQESAEGGARLGDGGLQETWVT
jgi:hypothetical protein